MIGDAGLIFPEDDANALYECLLTLYKDEELRLALKNRGRQRVLSNYTQQSVAEKTVAVYRQMMTDQDKTKGE